MFKIISPVLFFLAFAVAASASPTNPLSDGQWVQVARMADDGTGMFDGNGDLHNTYSFGTFTSANQPDDFARPFDVFQGMSILFTTGDRQVWGKTSYAALRSLIDAKSNEFTPNLSFESHLGPVTGNVLSRNGTLEDPWISLQGSHSDGRANGLLLWGENDWGPSAQHSLLQQSRGGIDVFVQVAPIPLPGAALLFLSALMGLRWFRRAP